MQNATAALQVKEEQQKMVNAINTAVANCANQQVNLLVLLTVTVWMNHCPVLSIPIVYLSVINGNVNTL